ncbi:MAG: TrkH family potassium uptake protein, partial [Clostridia bacterium]|nr:TrkH family potassium uptake protein [Clostridia bacterium]
MNFHVIKRTLGWILIFEAVFMLVPLVTGIVYGEKEIWSILLSMLICIGGGGVCLIGKQKNLSLYAKEGVTIVALSWIVMSVFGALPFFISRAIPSFVDALFETVSGFTTTGSTILPTGEAIEALPKCLLMWRSFTHWVGGMGVLVFLMAFLPLSGGRNMHIMKMESPGPSVGKLVPKVRQTAKILYLIYSGLTLIQFVMLVFGEMNVFEALNTAFATAGTGGFFVKGDSIGGYSSYTQIVVTVFMILFSINFNSYFFILCGKIKEAFNLEVRVFLGIVVTAILVITLNICLTAEELGMGVGETIKHTAFSVASVISTTGFSTVDFNLWPSFSKIVLVLLMFFGACAGSTGGGIKVSRMVILYKGATHEMKRML